MNKKAFTLIELLVGISISTILMISVGYLITGGIGNITGQKQIIENSRNFVSFQNKLNEIFFNIDTSFDPVKTGSGIIIKIKQNYNEGGFAYIGVTDSPISNNNGIYCLSGSEDINTKHIFIKTFIPGFDIDIQKTNKIDSVGKGFFGYNQIPKDGLEPDKVFLNNPTGKTSYGPRKFYSDTLNNRILYQLNSSSKIYELLNREDGIIEPTGLYFDNSEKALYIANSGNGEILKYSSKSKNNQILTLNGENNSENSFKIYFYNNNGDYNINNNISIDDFTFNPDIKNSTDTVSITDNYLEYSFSGGTISQNVGEINFTDNNNNFTDTGSYYAKLDINNKYYKYFVQGDDDLFTKDDNSLESLVKDGKYYNKITSASLYDYFNNYNSYTTYNKDYDYILKTPIKNLDIDWNNSDKLLKLELNYYEKYNCYNLEDKIEKKFIWVKSFK